jgi:hypothetical protein
MNRNRLLPALNPPFLPNLTPSDFYLFDKVEAVLMGRTFNDETELFQYAMDLLNGI